MLLPNRLRSSVDAESYFGIGAAHAQSVDAPEPRRARSALRGRQRDEWNQFRSRVESDLAPVYTADLEHVQRHNRSHRHGPSREARTAEHRRRAPPPPVRDLASISDPRVLDTLRTDRVHHPSLDGPSPPRAPRGYSERRVRRSGTADARETHKHMQQVERVVDKLVKEGGVEVCSIHAIAALNAARRSADWDADTRSQLLALAPDDLFPQRHLVNKTLSTLTKMFTPHYGSSPHADMLRHLHKQYTGAVTTGVELLRVLQVGMLQEGAIGDGTPRAAAAARRTPSPSLSPKRRSPSPAAPSPSRRTPSPSMSPNAAPTRRVPSPSPPPNAAPMQRASLSSPDTPRGAKSAEAIPAAEPSVPGRRRSRRLSTTPMVSKRAATTLPPFLLEQLFDAESSAQETSSPAMLGRGGGCRRASMSTGDIPDAKKFFGDDSFDNPWSDANGRSHRRSSAHPWDLDTGHVRPVTPPSSRAVSRATGGRMSLVRPVRVVRQSCRASKAMEAPEWSGRQSSDGRPDIRPVTPPRRSGAARPSGASSAVAGGNESLVGSGRMAGTRLSTAGRAPVLPKISDRSSASSRNAASADDSPSAAPAEAKHSPQQ